MRRVTPRTRAAVALTVGSALAAGVALSAQPERHPERPGLWAAEDHMMCNVDEMEWAQGPDSLPPGAEMAMIEGDPAASGPFTFRLRVPAGYEVPAHHHPQIEHVTVISGAFHMGTGDRLDKSAGMKLTAGGFAVMLMGTRHFAWVDEETVVQEHGVGPWGITYVDPSTDPRNKKE